MAKLEDLLKALLKMDLKYPQRNANYSEQICNIWAIQFSLKIGEFALNL